MVLELEAAEGTSGLARLAKDRPRSNWAGLERAEQPRGAPCFWTELHLLSSSTRGGEAGESSSRKERC